MRRVWVRERARSSSGLPGEQQVVRVSISSQPHARVSPGRVIFELGGVPIREELAKEGALVRRTGFPSMRLILVLALRLACDKLPTRMEFIDTSALPRLGNLLIAPESPIDAAPSPTVATP